MKQYTKAAFLAFFFSVPIHADSCSNSVITYFSPRSQSVNLPRIVSGWADYIHQYDTKTSHGVFSITPGYGESFKSDRIAQCLFGSSLQTCECPTLRITGSSIDDREECDWLADYFGLPTDFNSSIIFEPKVSNFFIDFALQIDFNHLVEGMWLRIWAPFVHTRWDLNYTENCSSASNDHVPGYFSDNAVSNQNLLRQARDFFQDGKTPTIVNNFSTPNTPVTFEALRSCRWGECNCDTQLTKNGIADIRFAFGWDFLHTQKHHFGVGLIVAGPTGTRPTGCNLFEPIIGNGHHWEVGGTISAHRNMWCNRDETGQLSFHFDTNITHLVSTKQRRCFDLCNRPLSRYMLAEKLGKPVSANLWGNNQEGNQNGSTQPSAEFKNAYAPVANLTCADVKVSVGVQADLVAMLHYMHESFSFDLGYNFWARSCEKIKLDCDCPPRLVSEPNTWALKGDSFVYGYYSPSGQGDPLAPVALSATQSQCATIHAGRNQGDIRNAGIDAPKFGRAVEDNTAGKNIYNVPLTTAEQIAQTRTSIEPLYINQCDINIQGARSRGQSHSIFSHVSYTWSHDANWEHYLGIGMQVEFARHQDKKCCTGCASPCDVIMPTSPTCNLCGDSKPNCNACCDSCNRCSLSQWSAWIKGGVSFN